MKRRIAIFDTTLRDGEQSPGCSMNLHEKLEVAEQLERLGVDVIEAGFAAASPGDFEAVSAVARKVKSCTIAALARALPKDIDAAWNAVRHSPKPRIHTFIATSPVHMKYKLRMSPETVLENVSAMVKYARNLCGDVEFSAEDSTRTEHDFLCRVLENAVAAGATVLNIPDTVGYTTPEEYYQLISMIKERVPGIEKTTISVHCHDDLGMGVANTLAAVRAGASQVECTINGIGERAGNAALEEVVMALKTREDVFKIECGVDSKQIHRTSKLLSTLIGVPVPPNKAIVGANAFAHESGIHQHGILAEQSTYEIMKPESVGLSESRLVLGKHSGRHAFENHLDKMGARLEKEEIDRLFNQFKQLADKKKTIYDGDIEALVLSRDGHHPEVYKLVRFIINSGNAITATASIRLSRSDEIIEEVAAGDGPVDASFKAIDRIVDLSFQLEDYYVQAVTSGKDAQGEVVIKVRKDDRIIVGRGLSTDIVEAGIKAYLHAANKYLGEKALREVKNEQKNPVL